MSGEVRTETVDVEFERARGEHFLQKFRNDVRLRRASLRVIMVTVLRAVFRMLRHRSVEVENGYMELLHDFFRDAVAVKNHFIEFR